MHILRSPLDTRALAVAVALALPALVACDGTKDAANSATPAKSASGPEADAAGCKPVPGINPGALAITDYIRSTTEPTPRRFLTAAGTDSAVTDEGMVAMQDKGPSYFYTGKETQKAKVRDMLVSVGPYPALLIVMHDAKNANGTRVIRLGGHFVTGEFDGRTSTTRTYTFACDASGWKQTGRTDVGPS